MSTTDTGTVTREQAEAVRQAVMDKYPAYCMTFAVVDGVTDYDTMVPAPESELPKIVEGYRYDDRDPAVPFAIVWETGPDSWAMFDFADPAVDVEVTTEAQEFKPGAVLRHKAVARPEGVWTDTIYSYALGIWAG